MSIRKIHAVDVNQHEIVEALRGAGATVAIIGEPVDILVGYRGCNILMEIKRDEKAKLTPAQVKFFDEWKGNVVRVETAVSALFVMRSIAGEKA